MADESVVAINPQPMKAGNRLDGENRGDTVPGYSEELGLIDLSTYKTGILPLYYER
ncbi:MAG: hypothetical protein ACOX2P_05380 [Bacillota bacterium]